MAAEMVADTSVLLSEKRLFEPSKEVINGNPELS